jgi:hypothetical protein
LHPTTSLASAAGNDDDGGTGDVVILEKQARQLPNPPTRAEEDAPVVTGAIRQDALKVR